MQRGSFEVEIAKFKGAIRMLKVRYSEFQLYVAKFIPRITLIWLQRHGITGSSIISVTLNLGQLYCELSLTEKVGCRMMKMLLVLIMMFEAAAV